MDENNKHPSDEIKVRFRPNMLSSGRENVRWIILIIIVSFLLSASLQFVSAKILEDVNNLIALIIVFFIVLIGIIFDIIGIAVTAADETPFHAMASRKLYGARQAISLIRNANKVSSFCNDVVGDICGVISGTASALIVFRISGALDAVSAAVTGLAVSGAVAALTVGGKAVGKTFAIRKSNHIVYKVSVILQFLYGRINSRKQNTGGKQNNKYRKR